MIPTPTHAANDYSLAPGQTLASRTGPALQAARTENLSSRRADRERWPQLRVHGRRSMGGRRLQISGPECQTLTSPQRGIGRRRGLGRI